MKSTVSLIAFAAIAARTVLCQETPSLSSEIPVMSPSHLKEVVLPAMTAPQPVIIKEPIVASAAVTTVATHPGMTTTRTINGTAWVHEASAYTTGITIADTKTTRWWNHTFTPCNGGTCTLTANPKLTTASASTAETSGSATTSTTDETSTGATTTSTGEPSPTHRPTIRLNIIRNVTLAADGVTQLYQTFVAQVEIPYEQPNHFQPCLWIHGGRGKSAKALYRGDIVTSPSDVSSPTLLIDGYTDCWYNGTLTSDGSLDQVGALNCHTGGFASQCKIPMDGSPPGTATVDDKCGVLYAVCDY